MIYVKVNGTEYPAQISGTMRDREWGDRDSKTITLTMDHAAAAGLFADNTPWSIVQRDTVTQIAEDGTETTEEQVQEWDNSTYSLAGPITDRRDGTVSVRMGKPTQAETAAATVTALAGTPVTLARAMALRPVIEQAADSLSDGAAAAAPELVTAWAYPVEYSEGDRRACRGKVYKCRQGHTSQEDWTPDVTPALWAVVDADHAGTRDDPIPASRGMEYEYGKYYLDGEDGKVYLCARAGEAAGGTVTLQYLPHELIGNYFAEAA